MAARRIKLNNVVYFVVTLRFSLMYGSINHHGTKHGETTLQRNLV